MSPGARRVPRFGFPKFGTCGSPCGSVPTPCPTRSSAVVNPACFTTAAIAAPMSPMWFPGCAAATPAASAAWQLSSSFWSATLIVPTPTVIAASV